MKLALVAAMTVACRREPDRSQKPTPPPAPQANAPVDAAANAPAPRKTWRVMPLGDSITDGEQVPGGYRVHLAELATAAGYRLHFVGSKTNGPRELEEQAHEGHIGWRIAQVDAQVARWLGESKPDIVLLLLGTNDIFDDDPSNAPRRLDRLVEHIHAAVPAATIAIGSIPPLSDRRREAKVVAFNADVAANVRKRLSDGWPVAFVDVHAAIDSTDLHDGIHPSAGGHRKIAAAWWTALEPILRR